MDIGKGGRKHHAESSIGYSKALHMVLASPCSATSGEAFPDLMQQLFGGGRAISFIPAWHCGKPILNL